MSHFTADGHVAQAKFFDLPELRLNDRVVPACVQTASEGSVSSLHTSSTAARDRESKLLQGDLITGFVDLSHQWTHFIPPPLGHAKSISDRNEEKEKIVRLFLYVALCSC
jgi:hypothetical protein